MTKNIVKEIIIILLLCLAIILLLGIFLYEYVPMNKTVPNTEAYSTPSNVKSELKEENANGDLIQTYEINNSDLDDYKRIQNYKPGKADPFSSYEGNENSTSSNTTVNNSSSGNNTTSIGTNGFTNSNSSSEENTVSNSNNNSQTSNSSVANDNSQSGETNNNSTSSSGGHFYKPTGTK